MLSSIDPQGQEESEMTRPKWIVAQMEGLRSEQTKCHKASHIVTVRARNDQGDKLEMSLLCAHMHVHKFYIKTHWRGGEGFRIRQISGELFC